MRLLSAGQSPCRVWVRGWDEGGGGARRLTRACGNVETKLLAKTIALAQLLHGRACNVLVQPSGRPAAVRRRYLLAAMMQILAALGAIDKAVGATDRYLGLVELLSHFSFGQALELLKDARWAVVVERRLALARLRRCLAWWQARARNGSARSAPRMRSAALTVEKSSGSAPTTTAFLRNWSLSYRLRKFVVCRRRRALAQLLILWHKWTLLKIIYEGRLGNPLAQPMVEEASFSLAATKGPTALLKFAFQEWRGAAKLLRRNIDNYVHDRRSVFEVWQRRAEQRRNQLRIATMYDSVRKLRPTLTIWCSFAKRSRRSREAAERFERRRLLGKAWDYWRGRRQRSELLSRFLGRWRGRLEFSRRSLMTAQSFLERKLLVTGMGRWRQRTLIYNTLHNSASRLICRRAKDQREFYFAIWRRMLRWIHHNSEKMRIIRAARIARHALNHWRSQCQRGQVADRLHRLTVLRTSMASWQLRLETVRAHHLVRGQSFAMWRRLLAHRRAICIHYQLPIPSRGVAYPELIRAGRLRQLVLTWRRQAAMNRLVDWFQTQQSRSLKYDIIKSWRMHTNVVYYLRQKPWRTKRRILRRLRTHQQGVATQSQLLEAQLADHLQGKRYCALYRGFERWQQIFQARKMEEHLCAQNLACYHHHQKTAVLRDWKLLTAEHMFVRYRGLQRRNRLFQGWHQNARLMVTSRRTRTLSRFLTRWRHSYRDAVAEDLLRNSRRKILRLSFAAWRTKCQKQRAAYSSSTEFISNSSLRYYLQRWRTELTVRRGNKNFAAMRSRQIPWKKLLEQPRYQNYAPATAAGGYEGCAPEGLAAVSTSSGHEFASSARRNTLTLPPGYLFPALPVLHPGGGEFAV